jgi:CRP/FNR family cyclic AMP-dependent transcriptional regulator
MSAPSKTILIIEDDSDIRENTAELLELEGYWVFTASNGDEGLQMAKSLKPDVVICDIVMPGIDGYTVFLDIMRDEETKNIRFVFSTAQSQKDEIDKARQIGATCYLLKPFDERQLLRCINGENENTVEGK